MRQAGRRPEMPKPRRRKYDPFRLGEVGPGLILGDIHLPHHDRRTIEAAIGEAKRRRVGWVILNGDTLDSHELSDHDKDPGAARYREEIKIGREFLGWIRREFRRARIIFKEGNHEARLTRYVMRNAAALSGIEGVDVPGFLQFDKFGIEWVGDKRRILTGKLNVIHGHEYHGGGGVNPARWLYLKAGKVALTNHFHRSSEHIRRNISGQFEAAWSVGCACHLNPEYGPLNEWNHGYALVEVASNGWFTVTNRKVIEGKVV